MSRIRRSTSSRRLRPERCGGFGDSGDLSCGHQGPQTARPLGSAELPQRLGLDLPDPLAGDIELLAALFKRVLALAANAERGDLRGTTGSWWVPSLTGLVSPGRRHRAPAWSNTGSTLRLMVLRQPAEVHQS